MAIKLENIKYSLRNLRRQYGRSLLTVFSILIGIATIFIFVSFGLGLYDYVDSFSKGSSADKVIIMAKSYGGIPGMDDSIKLTDEDLQAIERAGGVFSATGGYYNNVEVDKGGESVYTFLVSYDPKSELFLEVGQLKIEKGRRIHQGESSVAILGYNYLIQGKIFEKSLGINDRIEINGESLRIVGFFESIGNPADDASVYVSNEEFLKIFPDKESYSQIIARVNINEMEKSINNIERNLRKSRNLEEGQEDFFVQSFEDLIETYASVLDIIIGFVILIALISVVVSAINTANTMITSVLERYKEIGVLKAIGARNSEIITIFLFESSFLGFLAGIFGILLGLLFTSLANIILSNLGYGFLSPYYSIGLFAGCILFATITGAISGIIPAIKASKINPVDALRYE